MIYQVITLIALLVAVTEQKKHLDDLHELGLDKPTWMSTSIGNQISDRANDGDYNQFSDRSQCAYSKIQKEPYWGIDLLHKYTIRSLNFYTNAQRANQVFGNFKIWVASKEEDLTNGKAKMCEWYKGDISEGYTKTTIQCHAKNVRFIEIRQHKKGHLKLCEVEIFGYLSSNSAIDEGIISYNEAVKQSSTNDFYSAHLAVDGSRDPLFSDGSCSRTKRQFKPWWEVNLGQQYNVTGVVVYPRRGHKGLKSLETLYKVSADDSWKVCSKTAQFSKTEERLFFDCTVFAKYIRLLLDSKQKRQLTLCEVRVYGLIPVSKYEKNCKELIENY